MNHYITGSTIKALREKQHMTQAQLAEKLRVSDKAISKWETGVSLS
jgi:transcriptional regulator with XRE-family HTH domain